MAISKVKLTLLSLLVVLACTLLIAPTPAQAGCCNPCGGRCASKVRSCATSGCECQSNAETPVTIPHITEEFLGHRAWIINVFWEGHVLPSMLLMSEQITATAMQQMLVLGTFFDAKHQMETQRLLQTMQAQAHKDYHPSEGMCQFGTTTRSLAASERNSELTQIGLAARHTQRQLLSGDGISSADTFSRLQKYRSTYCGNNDLSGGAMALCQNSGDVRMNKDVNYTQTIYNQDTLDLDFTDDVVEADEEDALSLAINLYGENLVDPVFEYRVADEKGNVNAIGADAYMLARAHAAKRSVAFAAYAAQTAMKAKGEAEVKPYLEAILKEMGIQERDITDMVGERPSYHSQMDLLTKKLYQTPNFYSDLYDKPVNVDRKNVSMQAIGLMQKRDTYRSQLRSEAIMSVWLETTLSDQEELYTNEINKLQDNTDILELEGLK